MTVLRRCRRLVGTAPVAALLLVGLTSCSRHQAPASLALTFDVGSRQEIGPDQADLDASVRGIHFDPRTLACEGAGDYRRFTPTARVEVRDERGDLLASAPLGQGRVIARETDPTGNLTHRGCRFALALPLRHPARIYNLDVADGEFQRSYHVSELAASRGAVVVELD